MSADEHAAPISSNARACLIAFEKCVLDASQSGLNVHQYSDIEDQMARFSIWTSNMAVFSAAKSCMDHRLREAKDVQRMVLGMLEILKVRTMECDQIICQLSNSPERISQAPLSQAFNEFARVTAALSAQVGLFHEVSNVIRRASRESQNLKAAKSFVIRDFEGNDLEHELQRHYALNLWDRFPESSESIRERLSVSMITRRKRILYRRDRYSSAPMQPLQPVSKPVPIAPSALKHRQLHLEIDESLLTNTRNEAPKLRFSQLHSRTVKTATTLDQEKFNRVSAPSVVSSTRNTDMNDHEDLVFPSPPSAPNGHQSERTCQFCLYVLPDREFSEVTRWRKHILADLEPLVCLFDNCESSEVLYTRKKDWLQHMRKHTEHWRCRARSHGPRDYTTFEEFLTHMTVDHEKSFNNSQKKLLSEKGIQSNGPLFEVCPLCGAAEGQDNVADGNMIAHIVNHLRSIALRSLPPLYSDGDEDHVCEDNSESGGSRSTIKDFEDNFIWESTSQKSWPENPWSGSGNPWPGPSHPSGDNFFDYGEEVYSD